MLVVFAINQADKKDPNAKPALTLLHADAAIGKRDRDRVCFRRVCRRQL